MPLSRIAVTTLVTSVSVVFAQSTSGSAPTITTTDISSTSIKSLTYSATYTPGVNLPVTSEQGQFGTNACGTAVNATSLCQNVYINSVQDFCIFGPPVAPGSGEYQTISADERIEIAYCLNEGYGTRVMPDGTITGAHFVQTPDYVQVTGWGDFTKIGVTNGDYGGELDPHGYDGNGNPIGGLVFGNSYGIMQQYHEWTNFMSYNQFCIRACNPAGPNPAGLCNHIYDIMGCPWNIPGNYDNGYFEDCLGDSSLPMGVYGTSTYYQSDPGPAPTAHPNPPSSSCVRIGTITSGSAPLPTGTNVPSVSVSVSTMFSISGTITFEEAVATITETSVSSTGPSSQGAGAGMATGTATRSSAEKKLVLVGSGPMSLSFISLALFAAVASAQSSTTASLVVSSSAAAPATTTANPVVAPPAHSATYSATYTYDSLPNTTETGQTGTNNCGTTSSNTSSCQNLFVNSVTDFCLYGPPSPNTISADEEIEVAYCLNVGYGTRLFPEGTIIGAHFVQTPDYVQVSGNGDFTKIGVTAGDEGGELDPHGATGNGNPIGGLVFTTAYTGKLQQVHEWTNFMSVTEFCVRACNPAGTNPAAMCQHIYDLQGCQWNMPANYDNGYFENCLSDSSLPMGVYGTSTWQQGVQPTPPAHPKPSSSSCVRVASLTQSSVDAAALETGTPTVSTSVTTVTAGGSVYVSELAIMTLGVTTTTASTGAAAGTGTVKTGSAATATSTAKSGAGSTFGSLSSVWASAVIGFGVMVGAAVAV
ncbi:hypothetical protein FRB97_009016 [Tulasnella sp. 331]|nr:hypothetical protein FRB97_009016 [Tulasnella sp. 331]KAG8873123.1 hypothetical protein FRB98_009181 [Tulasnella sp. 332]